MNPAVASVYWYVGRGPWRSSKLGDWDADGLSFSTAEWIDKHEPAGELVLRGVRLSVYEYPKGTLAVPAGPAGKSRARDRHELTLKESFAMEGDAQTRKVVVETSKPDSWGVRQILDGPKDVLAVLAWDPEERRFVIDSRGRGTVDWYIAKQRKLR